MAALHPVPADDARQWRARAISHLTEVRARAEDRPLAAPTPPADPGGEVWTVQTEDTETTDTSGTGTRAPGWLWCVEVPDAMAIGDLVVADPPEIGPLWQAITELAAEREWQRLTFSAFRHDPVTTALADHVESTLIATKMQLPVDPDADGGTLTLQPMTDDRYRAFHQRSLDLYASELLESGSVSDPEVARQASLAEMARLLPAGPDTPDQLLFNAVTDAGDVVGEVWVALQPQRAFLYDIMVDPQRRGQGLGTQLLRAAAAVARDHGRTILALNVFGNNDGARRLYERVGFVTTETIHAVGLASSGAQ